MGGPKRRLLAARRKLREASLFARAMQSTRHPVLAQIIPIRRCNLSCAYCNEYDAVSKPVPVGEMLSRIDRLAELGTSVITLSGGEPMLHPELDEIIRRIRARGAMATLITNGYFLVPDRIRRLNRAGLDYLQISIDNVQPGEVSKKSLKVLDQKLEWLAEHAEFAVTINSVLGCGIGNPEDAWTIAARARALGFTSTAGVLHDESGQLRPLDSGQTAVYDRLIQLQSGVFSFDDFDRFQKNLVQGQPNEWHCRAGARFLYICEDGLVHYCSQQRGQPGIPLAEYTAEHIEREYRRHKSCEAWCTISCVHQTSMIDQVREHPREMLEQLIERRRRRDPRFRIPLLLRGLEWAFVSDPGRRAWWGRLALRLLGAKR